MRSPVTRSAPLLPAGSPRIAGTASITGDPFPGGGRYPDPAAAPAHARRPRAGGAGVTGPGPAASRNSADGTSALWPLRRSADYDRYRRIYAIRRLRGESRRSAGTSGGAL